MKIKNSIHYAMYSVVLLLIVYILLEQKSTPKIAVVNTQKIIEKYKGFQEAQAIYEQKTKELSSTFENQKAIYETKQNEIKILSQQHDTKELKGKEEELQHIKNKTLELGKAIENKAQEHEEKLLQGIYNKINAYISRYAKQNKIDLITGITQAGNVMYTSQAIDITDTIIEGINKEYAEGITK